MSRQYCIRCQRPLVTCICRFFYSVDNQIEVVILQHPKEVQQSKNSVSLLQGSLNKMRVFVGENFTAHEALNGVLNDGAKQFILLYPTPEAQCVTLLHHTFPKPSLDSQAQNIVLILIDGTWRKAFKMLQLSKNLQLLPKYKLPENIPSLYRIRTTKKKHGLSTLEACCETLKILEANTESYDKLLANFIAFNQIQLTFRAN